MPLSRDILSANERFGWESLDLISGIWYLWSVGFFPTADIKKSKLAKTENEFWYKTIKYLYDIIKPVKHFYLLQRNLNQ